MKIREHVRILCEEQDTIYKDTFEGRKHLYNFFEINNWFGFDNIPDINDFTHNGEDVELSDEEFLKIKNRMILWLKAYKQDNCIKYELLCEYADTLIPETTKIFREFVNKSGSENNPDMWRLLDFLLDELPCEIQEMTDEQTETIAVKAVCQLPVSQGKIFSDFLMTLNRDSRQSRISYRVTKNKNSKKEIKAYGLTEFAKMAYFIFNENSWKKNRLVEKACESSVYANLWVYLAMHFICGLRSSDIVRLPKPKLPEPGKAMRQKVLTGTLEDPGQYSREIEYRLDVKPSKPNKTRNKTGIPEIHFFIPVSLEKAFGIMLVIAASYHDDVQPGGAFMRADRSLTHIRNFWGSDFAECLGNKNFLSLSANKAYLQGLEMVSDSKGSNGPRGYMLASLARSHKGEIGKLSEITDCYLKDAAFTGLNVKFVMREMFERGIFGFIPHLLLESVFGQKYDSLPITEQTKVILQIGMDPLALETITEIRSEALAHAKESVSEALKLGIEANNIIRNLTAGNAGSKNSMTPCLMSAASVGCMYPERNQCLGCRYEIHTKAQIHYLIKEYRRLKSCSSGWKEQELIRKVVLPVLTEYTAFLEEQPDCEMDLITKIMKAGVEGYDYGDCLLKG